MRKLLRSLGVGYLRYRCFFKDECFKDEDEYRYVAIVPIDKLKDLSYEYKSINYKMYDFRLVNGVFVPYLKIPFSF